MRSFDPELEKRVRALENTIERGSGFTKWDWLALVLLGVALPAAALLLGWHS